MEPETPVLKYAFVAVLVIVVCFGIGYFVLGSSVQPAQETQIVEAPPPIVVSEPQPSVGATVRPTGASVQVEEQTDALEKKEQKEAEEAKKKAEEEQRKKDEEEAKRRREREEKEANQQEVAPPKERGDDSSDDGAKNAPETPRSVPAPPKERGSPVTVTPREEPATPEPTRPRPAPDPPAPSTTPSNAEPESGTPVSSAKLYRVRVGSFESRTNAQDLAVELNGRGYATRTEPIQVNGKTIYHVQVGAYREERNARDIARELKANGYDTIIAASSSSSQQ